MKAEDRRRLVAKVWRRMRLIGWLANLTGFAVVFAALAFLIPVFFDSDEAGELFRDGWPFAITIFVVTGLVITWLSERSKHAAFGWVLEGREPDEREHHLALHWPTRQALMSLVGWGVGGSLLAAFTIHHAAGFAVLVATAAWLAGEATAAMVYLLSERAQRAVTALALAVRQPERSIAPGIRPRLLFAWSLGTMVPVAGVLVVGIVGVTKPGVETEYVAAACIFLGAVALAVGLFATAISARAIADPIAAMREAMERVRAGDLQAVVPIDDASEVGQLQAGFNRMAEGLREREQIRDLFGRQVGHDVARAALRNGTRLGGEERQIGALFVDLVGSTSMALAMPPTEVVRLLNRFFRVVVEVVEGEGGFVNKFEGDAALCVFGAPVRSDDPAGQALCAARKLAERLDREVPEIGYGIGVSAGSAVAGNVGSESRFEYTVIGDPVNEAARLSDLAKERDTHLIAAETALAHASEPESERWSVGDRTVLRGRLEATGLATPA